MEGGLDDGCRPWSRDGEGVLEGRVDRGGDDKRGVVGGAGGGEDDGMDRVAMGRR